MRQARWWLAFVVCSAVTTAVVWGRPSSVPLADDWPLLESASRLSAGQIPSLFGRLEAGWYRPLWSIFLRAIFRVAGAEARPYHVALLAAYVMVSACVGGLAAAVARSPPAGLLATLTFAAFAVHAEPILWIAAGNETLAAAAALASFWAMRRYVRFGRDRWAAASLIWALASLMTKETAAFLPLVLCVVLAHPGCAGAHPQDSAPAARWRGWWLALYLSLFVVFGAFRALAGSPYPVRFERVPINLLYYAGVVGLNLPDNYGYKSSAALWHLRPWTALAPVLVSSLGSACLIGRAFAARLRPSARKGAHVLVAIGAIWTALALTPVALTATGRTAFMASIGWSWVVAGLAVSGARPGLSSALAGWGLLLAASLAVARYRAGAWHAAATVMRHTIEHVEAAAPRPACVVGLPDHLEHAYVRRNASPAMEQMLWPHREVRLVARGPDCDQPPEVIVPVSAPH